MSTSPEHAVHRSAAVGFSAASDAYERGRPDFPADAVDLMLHTMGAGSGATIVDVGAGTGKLTHLLAGGERRVVAVEPLAPMRAFLSRTAPTALAVGGVAEHLPLRDAVANGIVVAQAFHWFDGPRALSEFHRVLRPDGALALVWNLRDLDVSWVRACSELIEPLRAGTPSHRQEAWRGAFAATDRFTAPAEYAFRYRQPMTPDSVVDRHLSISFIAAQDEATRADVARGIRQIVEDDPLTRGRATFDFPHRTLVVTAYPVARSATTA